MENLISVLIVEDEEIWIQSLTMILNDFGYSVAKTVSTVNDAIAAFGTCDYDLVLMDIHLDGNSSGIELGRIINKMYHKPFIFITSSNDHNMKDAAMVNPSAYLTKPVNPSSLFIAIQSAINNFSNNRAPASTSKEEAFSSFFVKQGTRYKKIDWKDVAYMSAGKNYISVFNTADKTEYFIRSSIQKALQHLIPKQMQQQFVQINRAEVVQFSYITEVANDEVKTAHKSFVVSDTFMKDFRNRMNII